MLFLPFPYVVLLMSQHVADVNLVSIIMHSRDQSNFVAADIEDSEFPYLISMRKCFPQLREICKAALPHDRVPMRERRPRVPVLFREFVQSLSCNDVHST
jgi:hypothetical protein